MRAEAVRLPQMVPRYCSQERGVSDERRPPMDQNVPRPVVVHLDRADAEPLLAAGLLTLAALTGDLAERQATLSLVCQLRRALRDEALSAAR
jgi:hypothetical protein